MLSEQIKILQSIESDYDVMSITHHDVPLWHVLRVYLYDAIDKKTTGISRRGEASFSTLKTLFRSLFYFNPFKIFIPYDIWLFDSPEDRKIFNNKAILKSTGAIPEHFKNTLVFETPFPKFHAKKKQITDQNVVSTAMLFGLSFILESYFRIISLRFSNEFVLTQIHKKYDIEFNYKSIFYRFWAQYRVMSFLLKLIKKPKLVVINTPYVQMGYVLAFKEKNIKVIEFQHGVINENHCAYNSTIVNVQYSVDEIYVFGNREKQLFENENRCYVNPKHVYPTGSYILEKIKHTSTPDIFAEQRKQYSVIVVVAGVEPHYKKEITEFLNQAAETNNNLYFAYIPRKEIQYAQKKLKAVNIGVFIGNIYEFIKAGDIHATIHSTTCLESNYFGKATIFINLYNQSKLYYETVFQSGGYFADTPEEFVSLILSHNQEKIEPNPIFFANNHEEKVKKLISRYLIV